MSDKKLMEQWMTTPRERYLNDAQFRQLVNAMVGYITNCLYTPSEMREAAILASILYNEQHLQVGRVVPDSKTMAALQKSLQIQEQWLENER